MSRVFRTKRMRMTAWLLSAAVFMGSMDVNMLTVQAAQEGNLYAEENPEITEDTVPEADSSAADETVVENPDTAGQTQSEQGTVPEGEPQIENHEESAEVYSTPETAESDAPAVQADEGDDGETTPTGPLRVDVSGIVVKGKTYDGSPVIASGTLKAVVPKEISVSGREEDVTAQVSFMYSVSGTKEDGSAYNHPVSNVPNGNIIDGMPKDAGTYTLTIKVDDPGYVGTLGVQFKISKRRITIKVNDRQKRIGDDVPDFDNAKENTDYTVSNLVSGEKLITPPRLACEITDETKDTPGSYLITASDADAGPNYNIEYQSGTLTVANKVKVDISGVTISDKVYDQKSVIFDRNSIKVTDPTSGEAVTDNVTIQCSIVGKQKDGKLYLWDDNTADDSDSSKETELPSKAGDYTLIVAVTSLEYRGELRIEFSITQKPITLKADDLEIKQNDKIPTKFTYTKEGLLDGDTITKEPLYTCNISNTEKTGKYTIIPRNASAGSNYKITYVPGTLTVLEKDRITISGITTTPSPKVYDGTPVVCNTDNLKVVLNQSGVETDKTDKVDFGYSIEGTLANGKAYLPRDIKNGMPSEAGEYTITVTATSKPEETDKYQGSMEYSFSIVQRPIVIKVDDMTIKTEDKVPDRNEYTYSCYDTIAGMELLPDDGVLKEPPQFTCDIQNTDMAGTYDIVASDADAGPNYRITYQSGTLTVVEKEIVPTRNLVRIIAPAPVTNVENGTPIDKIELPETVKIVTRNIGAEENELTEINETAAVTWERVAIEGTSYGPRNEAEQIFKMGGTVVLPAEVDGGEVPLSVTVQVTVREKYAVRDAVAIPTASVATGSGVRRGTMIKLSCETEGAEIYYTLDSSKPDKNSNDYTLYNNPIEVKVNGFTVIWAYARKQGQPDSDTVKFYYYIDLQTGGEGDEPEVPEEDIPSNGIIPEGLWMTEVPEYTYTGKAIKPEVRVYDYKTRLEEKKDYTISYANNTKAADRNAAKAPSIIIVGKGNYEGKVTRTFTIAPKDISDKDVIIDDIAVAYNSKKAQKPSPAVLWNGKKLAVNKDYIVRNADDQEASYKDVGVYTLTVSGIGNYKGKQDFRFTITDGILVSKLTVAKIPDQTYTGKPIEPLLTVKEKSKVLTLGEDYRVDYNIGDHTNVGTATIAVIGMGNYAGMKRVTFKITEVASLNKAKVEFSFGNTSVYTGKPIRDDDVKVMVDVKSNGETVTRPLTKGTDYEVEYTNNVKVGTATATFTGKNAYSGKLKKTFKITAYDISRVKISLDKSYSYVKGGCKPEPVVKFGSQTLKAGTDYTLAYKQNNAAGSLAVLTVKGKGNFTGSVTKEYEITTQDIGKMTVTAADKVYQNKKNIYATTVQVTDTNGKKLAAGKDYDKNMEYSYAERTLINKTYKKAGDPIGVDDIIPAGTMLNVKITAKGRDYTGTVLGTYRITAASITKAKVSIKDQTYTGKAIELDTKADPQVVYVEVNGTALKPEEYEIVDGSYSNNINKGTAKVVIRGRGNYGGTKTATFKIKGKGLGLFGL
ncbi:MAG: hypothetical protein HDR17_00305 [Lachnospiraceae bacterium]|nr:hypothetical protein [Lachnospiraceae bacterium]